MCKIKNSNESKKKSFQTQRIIKKKKSLESFKHVKINRIFAPLFKWRKSSLQYLKGTLPLRREFKYLFFRYLKTFYEQMEGTAVPFCYNLFKQEYDRKKENRSIN